MRLSISATSVAFSAGIASISAFTLAVAPASALSIKADGLTYDLMVEETTFDDLRDSEEFELLVPWFGDEDLARTLATGASDAFIQGNEELGVPGGFFGPFFAFGVDQNGSIDFTTYINNEGRLEEAGKIGPDINAFYAVVDIETAPDTPAAVPAPGMLLGVLGTGLAFIRKRNLT